MKSYIYQKENWPAFTWDERFISALFGEVRNLQGIIAGQMQSVGFSRKEEKTLHTLTLDVVKSSEIEGERLNYEQVRSSIAIRLGIDAGGLTSSNRNVEGVVEMILDATRNYLNPVTKARLFGWHAGLFPTGFSGMYKIEVGCYRQGEIQVVSGPMGRERVHHEAVPSHLVNGEMDKFLLWLNGEDSLDGVLKAAVAHFWFIIIHPFDDGNGRIARAITDLLLTRSEKTPDRFYSMSNQILAERKKYYEVLQKVQHSDGDITEWLQWFLNCMKSALMETQSTINHLLQKAEFWKIHENTLLNERQRMMINKLFDGFDGKLQSSKWAKITKCSTDTALRDIKDLLDKGILRQESGGGRSTNYQLNPIK